MQARNTLAKGHGLNRMTAAAAGIALLAASALGVAVLSDQVELPLISGSGEISTAANTNGVTEIAFSEQNIWEYQGLTAPRSAESIRFAEDNVFDYVGAPATSVKAIKFAEDNNFDYTAPVTAEQVKFIEENTWDYAPRANLASEAQGSNEVNDYRFLEENIWERSSVLPHNEYGELDY